MPLARLPARCISRHPPPPLGQERAEARRRLWQHVRARGLAGFSVVYLGVLAHAAWVLRAPPGRYTWRQHSARVSLVFIAPLVALVAYRIAVWLVALADRRGAARRKALQSKLRTMVTELKVGSCSASLAMCVCVCVVGQRHASVSLSVVRSVGMDHRCSAAAVFPCSVAQDSTRFDKTQKLLEKYDPDYAPPAPPPQLMPPPGKVARGGGAARSGVMGSAGGVAAATLSGAGSRIGPVLGDLWGRVADRLIADDPTALGLVQEAQREADMLKQRLVEAEGVMQYLHHENNTFRHQLGLPPAPELRVPQGPSAQGPGSAVASPRSADSPSGRAVPEGKEDAEGRQPPPSQPTSSPTTGEPGLPVSPAEQH